MQLGFGIDNVAAGADDVAGGDDMATGRRAEDCDLEYGRGDPFGCEGHCRVHHDGEHTALELAGRVHVRGQHGVADTSLTAADFEEFGAQCLGNGNAPVAHPELGHGLGDGYWSVAIDETKEVPGNSFGLFGEERMAGILELD